MKRQSDAFNPFIALSDVTMATVVVLCCIFMAFMWMYLQAYASQSSRNDDLVTQNGELQKQLAALKSELSDLKEKNKTLAVLTEPARKLKKQLEIIGDKVKNVTQDLKNEESLQWAASSGANRMMIRLSDARLFTSQSLSSFGKRQVEAFGRALSTTLKDQMQKPRDSSEGVLVEIQIQGHTGETQEDDEQLWKRSINRAIEARQVLERIPDFPRELITVMGAGDLRTAYKASYDVINGWRKQKGYDVTSTSIPAKELKEAQEALQNDWPYLKSRLPDRLDIVLVYALDQNDDTYVPAHNALGDLLGPKTDTSHPGFPEH